MLDLAVDRGAGLANWVAAEARFTTCMVDQIVPALGPGDLETVARLHGRSDAAPVLDEPYRQWVIEDDFVDGARPDLAAAGAELVEDVRPCETMKLRMHNGARSALAYLGRLAGRATVD